MFAKRLGTGQIFFVNYRKISLEQLNIEVLEAGEFIDRNMTLNLIGVVPC